MGVVWSKIKTLGVSSHTPCMGNERDDHVVLLELDLIILLPIGRGIVGQ